ncbi:hypothetical protein V8E36_003500 [Tilletia maclaganii]
MVEGGPAPPPPGQGIHFTDEQFEQFMRRVTSAGRDPAPDKDNDPPLAHPTLNFDADAAVKIIKLWHDAPFDVPDDIVKLFNAGFNIPLSLLSVAAVRDYAVNARRSTFHPKMTGKVLEELLSWHTRDDALPFEEWAQASNTLLHLWRSIRVVPEDEPADQDPIQLFLEHFVAVSSQVTSVNWPIFREYDKRIHRIIWAPRGEGVGLPFHIRAIHQPTLTAAEAWISERLPVTIKSTGLATSAWNEVVTASTSDALRRTRELASAALTFYSQHVADSVEKGGKRARPNEGSSSSFRKDGDTSAGSSFPKTLRVEFCIICRKITGDHQWNKCPGPKPRQLVPSGDSRGFVWGDRNSKVCAKFNRGDICNIKTCYFGHYCSQCGADDHAARPVHGELNADGSVRSAGSGGGGDFQA